MQQLALDIGLASSPSLDNYHAGPNAQVLQHLRLMVGQVGAPRPPVPTYLWGTSGTGKSHLLRAVYEALRAQGEQVGWLDASAQQAQGFDERWSAVLLDDVNWFDSQQQAVAFNWFVNAVSPAVGGARWVLAAGDKPPADLPLRDDLRSRLGWGDVFALHLLSEDERRAVLQQQAKERGIALSDEVLGYMLSHFSRDLGSLTQLLDELDGFALRTQRAITVPLLKTMLLSE